MSRRLAVRVAIGFALLPAVAPAMAAPNACALPQVVPEPRPAGPSERDPIRILPTGSYTLAISWSPQFCRRPAAGDGFRCDRTANRFGFTLHGLWPDGLDSDQPGGDWPQYCRAAPLLKPAQIRANLCLTPSADMLQHEWAKHGICMSRSPEAYFRAARAAYGRVRFPDMAPLAPDQNLTVERFIRAFAAANRGVPGLSESAVRVTLSRDGWLQEVKLCLDVKRRFAPCGPGQRDGAARDSRMQIWPVE